MEQQRMLQAGNAGPTRASAPVPGPYSVQRFDAETEARYLRDQSRFYAPVLRLTVSFTILFYIAYLGADALFLHRFSGLGINLLMLGVAAPASAVGIAFTFLRRSDRTTRIAIFMATLVNGLSQVWAYDLGFRAGAPTPYEGMILIMCFGYFLLGMHYAWALGLSMLITLAHIVTSLYSGMPMAMLFDHATMMVGVIMIGAIAGYLQNILSRRSWLQEHRLLELATRDGLTGLLNRRAFDAALQTRVAECRTEDARFALLMIDIDHFKRINDEHGHDAGDAVLRAVAHGIQGVLRSDETVYRLGGEEFALMVTAGTEGQVHACAERIRRAVEQVRVRTADTALPAVTVSIGVALSPADAEGAIPLLQCADSALYAAKRSGRNAVCGVGKRFTRTTGLTAP